MKITKKFKDEKDFTINGVMPWLKTRKDYGDIEYTGGSDEYGRDIVFSKSEIGNRKLWFAVQVKDDDIKGTHKDDSGIREIVNQLKSAMQVPYTRKGDTAKIVIQGLMVVTLGVITRNAANLIKESDELKGRSVNFYTYEDILKDLKELPMNVTQVQFLIRLKKDSSYIASIKKLENLKSEYCFDIHSHEPIKDMFDSNKDAYVDLTLIKFFEEIKKNNWEDLDEQIKRIGFRINSISVRFYYSRVFNYQNLEDMKKRFFEHIKLKVYEDQLGPCFIYDCNDFTFLKEGWIENVNNLQILQEN